MIKCFFTRLLFLSLNLIFTTSCKRGEPRSQEAIRFEIALSTVNLRSNDTVKYLVWNTTSCEGCRKFSAQLLSGREEISETKVKFVIPVNFASELKGVNPENVFVDSHNVFGKYYLGIDNIGLITVYKNKVLSIENYQPNEMDSLSRDLNK